MRAIKHLIADSESPSRCHLSSSQNRSLPKDHIRSMPGNLVTTDICPWGVGTVKQCWSIWRRGKRIRVVWGGRDMGDTQEVTDREVKITWCSELVPHSSMQRPRVVGLGSPGAPGICDTSPQAACSRLFRHTQTNTSYEVKIATLPLMEAKPPNLCEPLF